VQDVSLGVKSFTASSQENRRQVLAVLARLLSGTAQGCEHQLPSIGLGRANVDAVLGFLETGLEAGELLPCVLACIGSLLKAAPSISVEEQIWPRIFDLLLRLRSDPDNCKVEHVDACVDTLASALNKGRHELYVEHLRTRLSELLQGAELELWSEQSPKRHILETLLRNAGAAVSEYIVFLLPVLARQARPEDAAASARVDILGLVHFLLVQEHESLQVELRQNAGPLLDMVLVPNCVWKAGQSNNAIRKGSLVCLHALLQRHLAPANVLGSCFGDLLPIIKSCLDDSWSPDNRMIACLVLTCLLREMQADITSEQLREVYPELLKRLDDSNDKIRIAVCEALQTFFKCLPPQWSRSLYEYILKTLFVHLDDPNPEIQRCVESVLESALHQDYDVFVQEARLSATKSAHPRACQELLRLAESLQQSSA
jgi:dynein assembly factor 5